MTKKRNCVLDFPTGDGNSPGKQKPPETSGYADVDPLNAADLVNSSILGTVYDGHNTVAEMIDGIRLIAPRYWHPSTDMVLGAIRKLVASGCLGGRLSADGFSGHAVWLTPLGMIYLRELVCREIRRLPPVLAAIAKSIKLRYLHLLEPPLKSAVLHEVSKRCVRDLYDGLRQQRNCSVRSDAEFERIEREIDWLRSELDLIRSFGAYLGEELKSPRTQDLPQL